MKLLHIYGQECYHDEVRIIGTPEALRDLGQLCLRASERMYESVKTSLMLASAADGEGYEICVTPVEDSAYERDRLPMPYIDEMAGGQWTRAAQGKDEG